MVKVTSKQKNLDKRSNALLHACRTHHPHKSVYCYSVDAARTFDTVQGFETTFDIRQSKWETLR